VEAKRILEIELQLTATKDADASLHRGMSIHGTRAVGPTVVTRPSWRWWPKGGNLSAYRRMLSWLKGLRLVVLGCLDTKEAA